MRKITDDPDLGEYLKAIIRYESDTGKMYWLARKVSARGDLIYNGKYAGKEVGGSGQKDGYKRIGLTFRSRKYMLLLHRVAWLLGSGSWPSGHIDHINHKTQDNRFENLRVVSQLDNARNMSLSSRNKSGITGVFWHSAMKSWRASVKKETIGFFYRIEDAAAAVKKKREELGFHENHGASKI